LRRSSSNYEKILVITDGVFSMDGDTAPVPEILSVAQGFSPMVMTMIDDAHGTGVFGSGGRGLLEHFGLDGGGGGGVDVQMGTLSKALGGLGGFVAGGKELIDFLKNKSRPFMFTTALPPAACAAGIEALRIVEGEEGAARREKLWENCRYLGKNLGAIGFDVDVQSPIIPVVLGGSQKALEASKTLLDRDILVPAIRPPTVPRGTSRLRVSLSSEHSSEHLDLLLDALRTVGNC
ncbi:MAG: aminotransferase class I/II-fold pyridoxal phosphate-dependent enzyme, partial [Planctomycetes bacterium]|nr:aminotransferase class I/II-fold pyridoxal phosphate-dependent enzyme [Planctomycetota bacterium]